MSSRARQLFGFLPSVYGVLAFSYVWILSGLILAITGWSQVSQIRGLIIPGAFQTALCFHAVLFTWLAVLGIYGIAAASLKRQDLVLGYLFLLGLHVLLSFIGGTYYLAMSYRSPSNSQIMACTSGHQHNATAIHLCLTPITMHAGIAVAIYLISWSLELYTGWMVYCYLQILKERTVNLDLEGKLRRPSGPVTTEIISDPVLIPNYKPASLVSSSGYTISTIFDTGAQGAVSGVQQHTWAGTPVPSPTLTPRRAPSPPTTPVTPSQPDFSTGIKPLMLTKKGTSSQPSSPHIPTVDITSSILPTYGSSPYGFSTSDNSFGGSTATTPTQAAYRSDNRF